MFVHVIDVNEKIRLARILNKFRDSSSHDFPVNNCTDLLVLVFINTILVDEHPVSNALIYFSRLAQTVNH